MTIYSYLGATFYDEDGVLWPSCRPMPILKARHLRKSNPSPVNAEEIIKEQLARASV